jgi:hypothetical protein
MSSWSLTTSRIARSSACASSAAAGASLPQLLAQLVQLARPQQAADVVGAEGGRHPL